jgi:hypothetical protein
MLLVFAQKVDDERIGFGKGVVAARVFVDTDEDERRLSETEQNALTVMPCRFPSASLDVTTVTPLAKRPSAWRNSSLLIIKLSRTLVRFDFGIFRLYLNRKPRILRPIQKTEFARCFVDINAQRQICQICDLDNQLPSQPASSGVAFTSKPARRKLICRLPNLSRCAAF